MENATGTINSECQSEDWGKFAAPQKSFKKSNEDVNVLY